MILEEETYKKFGYYPSKLKPKSGKKILAACDDCGKIRVIKKCDYRLCCPSCAQKGKKISPETGEKISRAKKGEKHPYYGKHLSEEHKRKISKSLKGRPSPKKGKPSSEKTKRRLSKVMEGANNPNYRNYWQLESKEWLEIKYNEEKCSITEIADIVDCSNTSVSKALRRAGIPIRSLSETVRGRTRFPKLKDKEWMWQKYIAEKASTKKIAECVGCDTSRVLDALRELSIPIRGYSEAVKLEKEKLRPAFLKDSEKLEELYLEQGKTIAEISDELGFGTTAIRNALVRFEIPRRSITEYWRDPTHIKKMMELWRVTPNKIEKEIENYLEEIAPEEFRYNGDFSCGITIGGLIPDFVNVNGKKIIIEIFGPPWHDPDKYWGKKAISWKRQEFGRKAIYSQYGYKCIIFWYSDLKKTNTKEIVLSTLKKEGVL